MPGIVRFGFPADLGSKVTSLVRDPRAEPGAKAVSGLPPVRVFDSGPMGPSAFAPRFSQVVNCLPKRALACQRCGGELRLCLRHHSSRNRFD